MSSIFTRRSIRRYTGEKIEDEKVDKILRAAMQAPSAGNQQGWEFIVVRDRDVLNKISKMSQYASMAAEADLAIIVLGNKNEMRMPSYMEQDLGAATQNLMLQAVEEGLGSVWLGVCPLEERMKLISQIFNLPEGVEPFAVVAIGYPAQENKFVDRYNENKVHIERYKG